MKEQKPVSRWIDAVKLGPNSVAEQGIWDVYFQRLQALAVAKLRNREDGEDVAISAMNSFFGRVQRGQFPDLNDRTELWPLLVKTAIWKAHNLRRNRFASKRDVRRERSLEWLAENHPTEELAATLIQEGEELLESLTDDRLHSVAVMKLEGLTNTEIAAHIGRSVKTVEWRLRQIRKKLTAAMGEVEG